MSHQGRPVARYPARASGKGGSGLVNKVVNKRSRQGIQPSWSVRYDVILLPIRANSATRSAGSGEKDPEWWKSFSASKRTNHATQTKQLKLRKKKTAIFTQSNYNNPLLCLVCLSHNVFSWLASEAKGYGGPLCHHLPSPTSRRLVGTSRIVSRYL